MTNRQIFLLFPPIAGEEIYPRVQNFIKAFDNLKISHKMAVKNKRDGFFGFLSSLPGIIKETSKSTHIIVFVSNISCFLVLFYKLLFRKKVIIDHFATEESAFRSNNLILKKLEKISYKIADLVLTHTESMKTALSKYYNIEGTKIIPIYSCVDTKLFRYTPSSKLAASLNLNNKFVLVYHGLFHKWHGVSYFLKAYAKIIKKIPNIVCIFVGGTHEEALVYADEFRKINKKFLRFVPRLKDKELPEYLSLGKIWVGRFNQNIFGKRALSACMIEAMGVGLVPLTSHSLENDKVIFQGINGLLVREKNIQDIAKTLINNIYYPEKIDKMSIEARKTVVDKFSIKIMEKTFKDIFNYEKS